MHEVLVNRLGGLSLPRKSVVRLTDRPDMTLDVYRAPSDPYILTSLDHFWEHIFRIIVDAHSKWPELQVMKTTTVSKTEDVLRPIFGRFVVPKQIVSDNGPQFRSEQFQAFVRNNGIQHKASVPWHPATNGSAERFVQSFKLAMKSAASDSGSLHQKIGNFLLAYRNSPRSDQ